MNKKNEEKTQYYVDYKIIQIKRLTVLADSKKEALEFAGETIDAKNIFLIDMPVIFGSYSICGVGKEKQNWLKEEKYI